MDIRELDKKINEFVKNEIEYILNYDDNKSNINSKIFYKPNIFYGVDYTSKGYVQVKGLYGIYLIYMNEDVFLDYNTVRNFNDKAKGAKFKEYKDYDLKNGTCIYIGSCVFESLYSRLNQHFKDTDNYGSLHLQNKYREILKDKIKIVAFPVKCSGYYSMDILMRKIEQELHNILKPTNGSSRV